MNWAKEMEQSGRDSLGRGRSKLQTELFSRAWSRHPGGHSELQAHSQEVWLACRSVGWPLTKAQELRT